jgi:DNA-binding response OmpR family regulator
MRAVLRRARRAPEPAAPAERRIGPLVLEPAARRVTLAGESCA